MLENGFSHALVVGIRNSITSGGKFSNIHPNLKYTYLAQEFQVKVFIYFTVVKEIYYKIYHCNHFKMYRSIKYIHIFGPPLPSSTCRTFFSSPIDTLHLLNNCVLFVSSNLTTQRINLNKKIALRATYICTKDVGIQKTFLEDLLKVC